jgi:hypothetical protein
MPDTETSHRETDPEQIPTALHLEYFDVTWGYADFIVHLGESVSLLKGDDFTVVPKFSARLTMAPATAKELVKALTDAVAKFESSFGTIWIPSEDNNASDSNTSQSP